MVKKIVAVSFLLPLKLNLRMSRRYPILTAIVAAFALLSSWPGLAHAQVGYTQLSNNTLTQTPYKFCGMVICENATNIELAANNYNVGGGAIAENPRLVQSTVILPYNYGVTGNAAFTQKNFFVQGYNSTLFPQPVPANAKPLRGYVYGTHYAQLVAAGGFFDVATLAVSFAVFYSNTPLTTSATVPSVVSVAGSQLGTSVTKLVVGYAGTDFTLYQTGPITIAATVISDPLWYFLGPSPIVYPYLPFMGGSVWVKEQGQWAYEGVALVSSAELPNAADTALLSSGTAFELINNANLALVTNAEAIVGGGNRTGPPRPVVNATNVYATVVKGKNLLGTQHVQVNNGGTGLLRFAINSSAAWLKLSPTSGASSTAPVAIALNYKSSTLAVGTYNSIFTVSNKNGVKVVNVQLQVVPAPVPAPLQVAATRTRSDGVLVTWKAVSGAVKYQVYRGPAPQPTGAIELGTTTTTNFLDTTGAPLQAYHYFVKALNAESLSSAFSAQSVGIKQP